MVDMFEKIGFGQWFCYVTGSFEVIGAVLLLLPRTAAIGGWLLAAVMIGAIGTHLFIIGGSPIPAGVLLVLAITVVWNRSRRCGMRLRRTYNAELFHSELESGAVETEACNCSIRAREFPLGFFQHGQNVSPFGFI
jgi:DoxX-like family